MIRACLNTTYASLMPGSVNRMETKICVLKNEQFRALTGRFCHEKTFRSATRSRSSFHRPLVCGLTCSCSRWLRSEPPSQQRNRPLHLGRAKSSMVSQAYGSSRRSRAQRGTHLYSIKNSSRKILFLCGSAFSRTVRPTLACSLRAKLGRDAHRTASEI